MNVTEIVKAYLEEHGYDGLFNADGECACVLSDLFPCAAPCDSCQPGYRVDCDAETCDFGGDCDFHIVEKKPLDRLTITELLHERARHIFRLQEFRRAVTANKDSSSHEYEDASRRLAEIESEITRRNDTP